jgi:sulfofructose kinase
MSDFVVCVGVATLDTIFAVPRHPAADDRVVASELAVAGGGPAATAAVALVRRGVKAYFVGSVGDDDAGLAIRKGLEDEGVDVSELAVVPGAISPRSSILVGTGARALAAFPGMIPGGPPPQQPADGTRAIATFEGTLPPLQVSARARTLAGEAAWVHADHHGYAVARTLPGRLSLDAGNAIADLSLQGMALFGPTETSLRAMYPGHDLEGSARAAQAAGAETVVFTMGGAGSIALTQEGELLSVPAPAVDVVSTLGAGDVFHGALLAELVHGAPLADAMKAANECAAMSCRALDGRSAIPHGGPL